MRIYFEKGDRVRVIDDDFELEIILVDYFTDVVGRKKILEDIKGTTGTVFAVQEGEGHKIVLYKKDGSDHSWKVPVSLFQLPVPLITALHTVRSEEK